MELVSLSFHGSVESEYDLLLGPFFLAGEHIGILLALMAPAGGVFLGLRMMQDRYRYVLGFQITNP